MKNRLIISGIVGLILCIFLVLASCTAPTPTPTPTPTTPTPPKTTPAPSPTQSKVITWKVQLLVGPTAGMFKAFEGWADRIELATGGRLKIELFPAGGIVSTVEGVPAVGSGVLDAAHTGGAILEIAGEPGAGYASTLPAYLSSKEAALWLLAEGYGWETGYEIKEKAYNKHNIHVISSTVGGEEVIQSAKPINTLEDFNGLRVRMTGSSGSLATLLGMQPTYIGIEELYTSLQTGLLDVVELSTLQINWEAKLHEVAPHIILPGWHQSFTLSDVVVNMNRWNELPDDMKEIVTAVTESFLRKMEADDELSNAYYFKKLSDVPGITITRLSEKDIAKIKEMAKELARTKWIESNLGADTIASMNEVMSLWQPWEQVRYR